jgi:hypothetical protein
MMRELNIFPSKKPHVRPLSINIDEPTNLADTVLYARHRLQEAAEWGELSEGWPGSLLLAGFILKAGGLFIWISIVSEYLRMSINPDAKLRLLLSEYSMSDLSANTQMDQIYSTILHVCKWDDQDFR